MSDTSATPTTEVPAARKALVATVTGRVVSDKLPESVAASAARQ